MIVHPLLTLGGWIGTAALAALLLWLLLNPRIRALTQLTILESLRRMEFQSLLLLGIVLILGVGYLLFAPGIMNMPMWNLVYDQIAEQSAGVNLDGRQLFQEQYPYYMMSAMSFFAEGCTIFMLFALGLFLISNDMQQGFLLTLLPKPLSRGEYLWGRGLGLAGTIIAAWLAMSLTIWLLFLLRRALVPGGGTEEWKLLLNAGVLMFKWAAMVAILFMATLRLPPMAGGFAALILCVGGHISLKIHDVATDLSQDALIRAFAWTGYVVIPHFDHAWSAMILDPEINPFQTAHDVARFIGWSFTYGMICGLIAWWYFRRRDL